MAIRYLGVVVLLVLFASTALAQQIYTWKDKKGQWHFSDSPPTGTTVQKVKGTKAAPQSSPATSPYAKPSESPAAGSRSKEEAVSKLPGAPPSDVSRKDLIDRWLLLLPPNTQTGIDDSRPFSEWRPWQSFDSAEACKRVRVAMISRGINSPQSPVLFGGSAGGLAYLALKRGGRCISSIEFKPSKEANVIVVIATVGRAQRGPNAPALIGRVFNRGQATARNVVVKYQALNARGLTVGKGKIHTIPHDIPGLALAEFRGEIPGGANVSGLRVNTELDWSKN